MANFLSGVKALVQLYSILTTLWNEWKKLQEEKAQRERDLKAIERAKIEKELERDNLTTEQRRKLLADLTNNLPY